MNEKTEIYFGKDTRDILNAHTQILGMHYRALACHCECLGMNAENMQAACANTRPPYSDDSYIAVMRKWGLVDQAGRVIL